MLGLAAVTSRRRLTHPGLLARPCRARPLALAGNESVDRCTARRGDGRGQVDHRLVRQSVINEFRRGRLSQDQVCDAHPELIRAASNVGTEITDRLSDL